MPEHSRLFRAARALLGVTQQELAAVSGISKATLNNIERDVSNPRKQTIVSVEQALARSMVVFDRAGEETSILYKKLARPSKSGLVHFAGGDLLQVSLSGLWSELTEVRSLYKTEAFIFFTVDAHKPEPERSIGGLVVCQGRLLLLDRLSFPFTRQDGAAAFGKILQRAFHFHAGKLFYLPTPPPSLDDLESLQACTWIDHANKEPMTHVLPLLLQLGDWRRWLEPWLQQRDHPLRSLFLVLESENPQRDPSRDSVEARFINDVVIHQAERASRRTPPTDALRDFTSEPPPQKPTAVPSPAPPAQKHTAVPPSAPNTPNTAQPNTDTAHIDAGNTDSVAPPRQTPVHSDKAPTPPPTSKPKDPYAIW